MMMVNVCSRPSPSHDCGAGLALGGRRRARRESQLQFVGDFRRNILKADRRSGYAFESNAVERQSREFADFDLPLDERIRVGVSVDAEKKESLPLFVITVVGVQHLK